MVNLIGEKVLVTGAKGFIGCNLVEHLKKLNAEVISVDVDTLDITDFEKVKDFLLENKPNFIFHLAAVLKKDHGETMKINFEATKNMLDSYGGYERFVYVSTSEFYFGNRPPFREDMEVHPTTPYSESKFRSEQYCLGLIRQGKPITIVRPSIVYGPGQKPGMFIPSLIKKCINNQSFDMSPGGQTRDFIFINDLLDLFIKIITNEKSIGQAFNAGSGESTPLKKAVNLIKQLSGSESIINFGAMPYRENEIMEYYHDISKAKELLGWQPKTSLEDGLRKTISAFKDTQPF